jgi:hypothetical protein
VDEDPVLLTQNITFGTKDLDVRPTTAVPGQEITISGSGFTSTGDEAVVKAEMVTVDGDPANDDDETVDSNGNISITVRVPAGVSPGTRQVMVTDGGERVGVATITVPEPSITVDPAESLIGSEVTISGIGFPANDLVQIRYDEIPVRGGTAPTDPTGDFSTTIIVPSSAGIGETHDVSAAAQLNNVEDIGEAKAEHTTPTPELTITPASAESGSLVTVSGANYKGFIAVRKIEIDQADVTSVPSPNTDAWGSFSAANVRVPRLDPGRYTVKVDVGGRMTTAFIEIIEAVAVVVTDPADVFAPLGDRLVRVWYLERATQIWSFYDPDPDVAAFNTLTEVSSGQNVSIIISRGETIGFQDKTLYPGTNPIALK